jgi:XTP/dITP diphosphohydrolase
LAELLLASTNPSKLARLRWLIQDLPVIARVPTDLEPVPHVEVAEDAPDFMANAAQKATAWSRAGGGMLTLATDGGLYIPSLASAWEALRTRRSAGAGADAAMSIARLLALMQGKRGDQRQAYWHEAVALARGDLVVQAWSATGDAGLIAETYVPSAADTAFWTESIRFLPAAGKLYRDLTEAEVARFDTVWPALRLQVRQYFGIT